MVEYLDKCFYDAYDGILNEYLARVECQFERNNPEYSACVNEEETILDKYPTLRKVVDDREVHKLSQEEIKALIDYLDSYDNKNEIIKKLMFYKGYKEAYYLFNKLEILKTNKDNI